VAIPGEETMQRKTILVTIGLLVLSTMACSLFSGGNPSGFGEAPTDAPQTDDPTPAETNAPPSSSGNDACLVGSWSLMDIEQYMASVLPPELTETGELTYDSSSGSAVYTFTTGNTASIQVDEFTVKYQMNMAGISLPLEVMMDGSGSGSYTIKGNQMLFNSINNNELYMTISLGGAPIGPAEPITGFFPGGETTSSLTYECSSTTLALTMPVEGSSPVILERTSP